MTTEEWPDQRLELGEEQVRIQDDALHGVLGLTRSPSGYLALSQYSAHAMEGQVWVREKDELDVESVAGYELHTNPGN